MKSTIESKINTTTRIKKGFFGIILTTFIFSIFFSGLLNIASQVKDIKGKNFIMAELKSNVSQDRKEELEEKFLNLKEVSNVTYVDSYTAFQELQKDLGIVIPRGENPLPNTFRIYFNNPENLEKLQTTLEETEEIKEFFMDNLYITEINRRVKVLNLLGIVCIVASVCSLFILNTILKFQIETEYLINLIKDENNPRNVVKAKNVNLLPSTIAILLGNIAFFNFYIVVRKALIKSNVFVNVLSLLEIFYIEFGVILLLILWVWFMPVVGRRQKGKETGERE